MVLFFVSAALARRVNAPREYINNTRSFPAWDFSNTHHWLYVSWLHSVHLQVRARYCTQNSNARIPYDFAWVMPSNPSLDGQVSIDIPHGGKPGVLAYVTAHA